MAETKAPEGYFFTEKHEWVKLDGDFALVGISDYAQQALGDIVFVDLPKPGKVIKQMEPFGTIESVKAAEDLNAPLSGEVIQINPIPIQDPATINGEPFEIWLIKIKKVDINELINLMDSVKYFEFVIGLV